MIFLFYLLTFGIPLFAAMACQNDMPIQGACTSNLTVTLHAAHATRAQNSLVKLHTARNGAVCSPAAVHEFYEFTCQLSIPHTRKLSIYTLYVLPFLIYLQLITYSANSLRARVLPNFTNSISYGIAVEEM